MSSKSGHTVSKGEPFNHLSFFGRNNDPDDIGNSWQGMYAVMRCNPAGE
jgi:hypothetical protein